jgi:hypothetical protein
MLMLGTPEKFVLIVKRYMATRRKNVHVPARVAASLEKSCQFRFCGRVILPANAQSRINLGYGARGSGRALEDG